MMTVRFPSGVSIQYNNANYVIRHDAGYTDIYEKKDGRWIAQVPSAGCVIEVVPACRVYDGLGNDEAVEHILRNIKSIARWKLEKLKRCLADYNMHTGNWKA